MEQPQTWHHGLVARWWAEFNVADAAEVALWQGLVARPGQPVLDLACGAGRLLLPLRRAGLDVDGVDLSADMLAACRRLADAAGTAPRLVRQAFHELNLPRRYGTVLCCDSFGIGGRRADDLEGLRRCHAHLLPGGTLAIRHDLPHGDADWWPYWLPGRRADLPLPWPEAGTRKRAADGDEIELQTRLADLDPLAQRVTLDLRATLLRDGQPVAEERHVYRATLYFRDELELMLRTAGFADVAVLAADGDRPAAAADTRVMVVARKAG